MHHVMVRGIEKRKMVDDAQAECALALERKKGDVVD